MLQAITTVYDAGFFLLNLPDELILLFGEKTILKTIQVGLVKDSVTQVIGLL